MTTPYFYVNDVDPAVTYPVTDTAQPPGDLDFTPVVRTSSGLVLPSAWQTPAGASRDLRVELADLPAGTWTLWLTVPGESDLNLGRVQMLSAVPLTLEEAKEGLNITSSDSDSELAGWLAAATELAESITGPLTERTVTETHEATTSSSLYLRETPVIGVDAVDRRWDGTELWPAADVEVEPLSGRMVMVQFYGGAAAWNSWGGTRVTYRAGRTEISESIRKAIIIILDHLWQTQRGWQSGAPSLRGELPQAMGGPQLPAGFALPNRAAELLAPYKRVVIA